MTTLKVIATSLLIAAASTAFAGTDDGSVTSYATARVAAAKQAPAPVAAAAAVKADAKNGAQDFLRQQAEGSGY